MNDEILTHAAAAAALGVGQSTLHLMCKERRGPVRYKLPGSSIWRYRQSDLAAFEASGRQA